MKDAQGNISRRDWLAASGLAAGALAAAGTAPAAPVSVAKVRSYDEDLVAQFQKMFDQIGGIGSQVQGKTVAIKVNLTGGNHFEGFTAGDTHWVHPKVVGAVIAVIGKLGAKRIRLLESVNGRRPNAKLEDKLLVVGRNSVNTDAVSMATMGYNPRAGRHEAPYRLYKGPGSHPKEQLTPADETFQYADNMMLLGEAVGIGSADLGRIDVRGVPIHEAVFDFEAFWKNQMPKEKT